MKKKRPSTTPPHTTLHNGSIKHSRAVGMSRMTMVRKQQGGRRSRLRLMVCASSRVKQSVIGFQLISFSLHYLLIHYTHYIVSDHTRAYTIHLIQRIHLTDRSKSRPSSTMPSILRRRRSQHKPTQASPLRPSLSLPDITSPLLDTGKWEWDEVPDLITSAHVTSPNITSTSTPQSSSVRNRAPSLVRDSNSPVQFHCPFTPWQIVGENNYGSPSAGRGLGKGDFRDMNKWRASAVSQKSAQTTVDMRRKARNRVKALESLNVVVAGGKGSGKTR